MCSNLVGNISKLQYFAKLVGYVQALAGGMFMMQVLFCFVIILLLVILVIAKAVI